MKDWNTLAEDIYMQLYAKKSLHQETLPSGLLFIRKDIYGGDDSYLQDENTLRLKAVRNSMEHRAIIVTDEGEVDDSGLAVRISRSEFEDVAITLISTVRQAIFCFVNMVNHIEYDKKNFIGKAGQIVIPQAVFEIDDKEKV